jgi:hypothetical protein
MKFLTLFYRVNVCLFQQWKAILRQEKGAGSLSFPGSLGKIEQSFSHKLTDYVIQGVRNVSSYF